IKLDSVTHGNIICKYKCFRMLKKNILFIPSADADMQRGYFLYLSIRTGNICLSTKLKNRPIVVQ
ncbi:MAG: hypothetical protein ACRDE5_18655, partial [Ginsengibacter sp.]